jgi:hypothetical protein
MQWHNILIPEANCLVMPNWLRALIAGYGAKKLGGGCFSTILIFIVLYWLLGHGCGGGTTYHHY